MTLQQLSVQVINFIQFQLRSMPGYAKAVWFYVTSGACWRDSKKAGLYCYQFLNQLPRWRLLLLGAALYLLSPFLQTPYWQLQLFTQSSAETSLEVKKIVNFYQQYGDAALPALQAQLQLEKLRQLELQLIADQSDFASQSRDDKWAEATEFMIAHLAQSVTENQLRILDSECRNNLCRIEIHAPKGLTPDFQALVLKYASTLKRGDLEFQDLVPGKDRILLELKSDKKLKYGYWASRRLEPAAKAQWQQQVKAWLQPNLTDSDAVKTLNTKEQLPNNDREIPVK